MTRVYQRRIRLPASVGAPLLGVALMAGGACADRRPPLEAVVDLIESFPDATVHSPTRVIDFGTDTALPHQVHGWHDWPLHNEANGLDANWSQGEWAEVEFFVAELSPLPLLMRCSPVGGAKGGAAKIDLAINGQAWTTLELRTGLRDYRLRIPGDLLRPGPNRLLIRNPDASGKTLPSLKKDVRVLWDVIEFGDGEPATEPGYLSSDGAIYIPLGSRVDFYLSAPPAALLEVGHLEYRGSAPRGRLQVSWQAEPMPDEVVLAHDLYATEDWRVEIVPAPRSGRLSMFALGESSPTESDSSGFFLSAALVMGRSQTSYQPTESAERTPADRPKPNVLIYLVDTLRADHLGAYGYGRPTSPHLDQFAEGSVLFERARAQSPWTRASVASVFTGLWPQVHGANGDSDLLGEGALTLAEVLREVGYETAGITTNGNTTRTTGFAQGFEHFEFLKAEDHLIRSPELNRAALEWLDRRSADRPFFLYLHTIDPHAPYAPQEPFRAEFASEADPSIATIRQLVDLQKSAFAPPVGRKEELVALYDGEIAANDAAFGALLAALRERGLFDDTLIIFLSDHGEEFYEHGSWQHGKSLYAEILDVPLVIKLPSMKSGRRVGAIVQHVDLMPTILDYLGAMDDYEGQGRSMLALIEGRETAESWEDYAVAHMHLRGARASTLLTREWKLIQPWANDADVRGFPELYRLSDDPGEARNLAPELTNQAFLISARLSRLENAAGAGVESRSLEEGDLADEEDQLRALGYIED